MEEDRAQADKVLLATCTRLGRQFLYNQRNTSRGHFWAERGVRVKKGENYDHLPPMTVEDYMTVS